LIDHIGLTTILSDSLEDAEDALKKLLPEIYRKAERQKHRVVKIDVTPQFIFQTDKWMTHVAVQLEPI
jgi:chorismate mutase